MLFGKKRYCAFWKGGANYYFLGGLNFNCPILCQEKLKFWGGGGKEQRSSAPGALGVTNSILMASQVVVANAYNE